MTTQDNNEAASADLIARIVDRDTPPDGRNDVVDHDIRGNPITRGMVDSMAKAASASQSSTAGAAKRGNTCDIFGCHFYGAARQCNACTGSDLAHVARQRQESPAAAAVDAALKDAMIYGAGMYIAKPDGSAEHVPPEKFRAAVAEGVDTALPPPALTVADEPGRGHYYSAEQMAQQREAGRLELAEKVTMLERTLAVAQTALESRDATDAIRARQPVSEGLTAQQVADGILTNRAIVTELGHRMLLNGDAMYADLPFLTRFANAALALSAAPPAKAEGMSDSEVGVIGSLIELAARAYDLMDNSEERGPVGASELLVQRADFDNLSAALDVLDQLPDDRPGYVLSGPARAAWALRAILAQQAQGAAE